MHVKMKKTAKQRATLKKIIWLFQQKHHNSIEVNQVASLQHGRNVTLYHLATDIPSHSA